MRLLFVGDVHISDRPPSTRQPTYREDILAKLLEIGEHATTRADAVVFVGDIFHSKRPQNTSHQTVQAVARILGRYPCPVYILPGNHDYAGRNHLSLVRHPLGTVALMPNVELFGTDARRSVDLGGVRLWGVREEESLASFRFDHAERTIVVAHCAIFPPGQKPIWESWEATEVAEALDQKPELVYYGHIHEPHGVYEAGGVTFANLGAISRGSLHEEGALDRVPQVGLVTVADRVTVEGIDLASARPASEVFRVAEVTKERSEAAELSAFTEALSSAEVEVFSVERAVKALREHSGAPEAVRERAVELVEAVG